MNYFAVFYDYPAGSTDIAETRPVHREFLGKLKDSGILVGSGPFLDEDGGALIVIRLNEGASVADAEEFFNQDPFYVQNLLTARTIRPWNPVLNVFN